MINQLDLFSVAEYTDVESRFATVVRNDSLTNNVCTNSLTNSNTHHSVVSELISTTGVVNTYYPAGTAKGENQYFRYSWRDENRVKHKHIPGGNTGNKIAVLRAELIHSLISVGKSPREILEVICFF